MTGLSLHLLIKKLVIIISVLFWNGTKLMGTTFICQYNKMTHSVITGHDTTMCGIRIFKCATYYFNKLLFCLL